MTTYQTKRIFFDCETLANPESLALAPEPVVTAPANYKDPVKIEEYIAVETEKRKLELIEKAALDPDYGKILSIGYAIGDGPITVHVAGEVVADYKDDDSGEFTDGCTTFNSYTLAETDLIENFWSVFATCRGNCVGFNILSFDLPYLMRRSMALGVKVPFLPVLAKYRCEPVTDLYGILFNWDWQKSKGLKQIAKLYGLKNECPDVDGSKVKDLDLPTLRQYQASDVRLVIDLFNKMNGIYFKL